MSFAAQHIRAARNHLRKSDPRMRLMIQQVGPFTARIRRDRFGSLAGAIVAQQISGSAAKAIWNRLNDSLGGTVESRGLLSRDLLQLREVGLSRQKGAYLLDLAEHVERGDLVLSQLGRKSDEVVITELTKVRGIGRWTAQMFLMFCLGRLDVLPVDDQGIKTAIRERYELDDLPGDGEIREIAEPWRPYATVASWYLWQWLDNRRDNDS